MQSIFSCRGLVFTVTTGKANSAGFIAIEPAIQSPSDSPVLLFSDDSQNAGAVTAQSALNDDRILYLHGRNFIPFNINGVVLLGESSGLGYKAVEEWFEKNIVTNSKTPVNVSLPGKTGAKVFITALAWGPTDAQFHTKTFAIAGLRIPPPRVS